MGHLSWSRRMKHEDEYRAMRELEVGDDVTDDTIEAYNTLIHGPRHVKHQGRPRDGDKVLFTRHTAWTSVGRWFDRSIPGYENHEDSSQTFEDETISAGGQGHKDGASGGWGGRQQDTLQMHLP